MLKAIEKKKFFLKSHEQDAQAEPPGQVLAHREEGKSSSPCIPLKMHILKRNKCSEEFPQSKSAARESRASARSAK